ncbi:MAG TPA: hypothetical protein VFK72_01725, partial [Nevskia sp.]|nr:hypothetical protein [Nevskia sp.]
MKGPPKRQPLGDFGEAGSGNRPVRCRRPRHPWRGTSAGLRVVGLFAVLGEVEAFRFGFFADADAD